MAVLKNTSDLWPEFYSVMLQNFKTTFNVFIDHNPIIYIKQSSFCLKFGKGAK